jgi:hypothetical protein
MKNFRWPIAVTVFILTLATLAGIIIFRERQLQNRPLLNRLKAFEEVETVTLRQSGGVYRVSVQLAYVPDLPAVYREIDGEIAKVLGERNYRLELLDRRDETLSAAYSAVHLALYEGERRGNFTEMSGRIDSLMAGFDLHEHRLTVDAERIYFQAANGSYYLYAVIARRGSMEEGEPG